MNSMESAKQFHTYHRAAPSAVAALNCILRNDESIQIVISSTWRELHSLDYITGWLEGNGVIRCRVLDKTCSLNGADRGEEITAWIREHDITSYVVLDDDAWKMVDHQARFINTDFRVGLTIEDARRANFILAIPFFGFPTPNQLTTERK